MSELNQSQFYQRIDQVEKKIEESHKSLGLRLETWFNKLEVKIDKQDDKLDIHKDEDDEVHTRVTRLEEWRNNKIEYTNRKITLTSIVISTSSVIIMKIIDITWNFYHLKP